MSLQSAQKRVQTLREQLEAAEAELSETVLRRQLEPPVGAAVQIKAKFPGPGGKTYRYLAFRAETPHTQGQWFVTGTEGPITWDRLLARVERADFEIEEVIFP